MSNTPPSDRHQFHVCKPIEDTAHISLYLRYKDLEHLVFLLESAKQAAKNWQKNADISEDNSEELIPDILPSQIDINGCIWNVCPNSISKNRLNFPYILKSGGVTLMLNTNDCGDTMANGWLEFGSIPLTHFGGLKHIWQHFQKMFQDVLIIDKHILSRCDLCIDVLNMGVEEFCKRFQKEKYITNAKAANDHYESDHRFGRRSTGITIGTLIRMNIYDKMHESRNDDIKMCTMLDCKWKPVIGAIPDSVTRIEFQNKRKGVKEYLIGNMRIDTVEDWEEQKPSILNYLMHDFFRFIQGKVDRKNNNQHRAKIWRVWERIYQQAAKLLQDDTARSVMPVQRKARESPLDMKALIKQGVACLVRSFIFGNGDPNDLSALYGHCAEKAYQLQNSGELAEIIKRAILDKTVKI